MNIQRLKLVGFILLLELLMCGLFALFVEYGSEADARNVRNSFDPVFGGLSPDKNQLKKYYNSKKKKKQKKKKLTPLLHYH